MIIIPHTTKPQPEYGIIWPLPNIHINITPIGLVIVVIIKNVENFIVDIPATKQRISSGNNGKRNAIDKKKTPRFASILEYFIALSYPTTQLTILKPKVLPIPYDIYEPSKIPIVQ